MADGLDVHAACGLDLYHSGFVVDDVEAAMAAYARALGVTWAPLATRRVDVLVDGERVSAELLATYSVEGPPHLELIEEVHGGVWGRDGLAIDHVGYWTTSFRRAVDHLASCGFPAVVSNLGPDGEPCRFAYHRTPSGLWIEVVDRAVEPEIRRWLDGGTYGDAGAAPAGATR